MVTALIIYILFGLCLTISTKTNLMANERWYLQALYVVAYPVVIYIMLVKVCLIAIKLTEMMDDIKSKEEAWRGLQNMASPIPGRPIIDDEDEDDDDDDEWIQIKVREGSYVLMPGEIQIVVSGLRQKIDTLEDLARILEDSCETIEELNDTKTLLHKITNQ